MPGSGNWSEITILKEELEASLEMYASLKKENQELRQEIARLKSQISSLKANDNERKSVLWKKIHHQNSPDVDHKSTEESLQESIHPKALRSNCIDNKEKEESVPPPKVSPPTPSPPPPPPKSLAGAKALRRVPEVIELYRSLTRKDAGIGGAANQAGVTTVTATRSMIGEIENRSAYLSAIKTEVDRQGPFIDVLIKQVESATFGDISEVEAFVKWLDGELASLVDERAVLKHFPMWPENKADALREAAFSYRDMANLDSEVASFRDDPKEPFCSCLRQIQALQDRLEQSVHNVERLRELTIKRYKNFQIPWQWMLETGLVGQMRLNSLRLSTAHMKRVVGELLRCTERSREDDHVILQGIRFAHRTHQFAGGFDKEAVDSFQRLKKAILDSEVGPKEEKSPHFLTRQGDKKRCGSQPLWTATTRTRLSHVGKNKKSASACFAFLLD